MIEGRGRRSILEMRPDMDKIIKDIVLEKRTKQQIADQCGVSWETVSRFAKRHVTEEKRRAILAKHRIEGVEADTDVINQDRMDVALTYETLARRVERLITKAEQRDDDGFALAAMEGLRKTLRDIAQLQGKLATSLTVNVTLAESAEWVALRGILQEVCDEVPAAREPLLRHMRKAQLSVTKEPGDAV